MKNYSKCDRKYTGVYLLLIGLLAAGLIAAAGCSGSKSDTNSQENAAAHSNNNSTPPGNSNPAGNSVVINNPDGEKTDCQLSEKAKTLSAEIDFQPNSFKIMPETEAPLRDLAEVFKTLPANCLIEVQTYATPSNNEKLNIVLTESRSNAIKDFLVKSGVPKEKITAVGKGSSNSNSKTTDLSSDVALQEKRTEFRIYPKN